MSGRGCEDRDWQHGHVWIDRGFALTFLGSLFSGPVRIQDEDIDAQNAAAHPQFFNLM